jgi:hypothetical protein
VWGDFMLIKERYAALGVSYNTLSTLKSVLKFSTIEEAYQFWKHQKDAKDKKKQHLIDVSNQLGITEKAVRMRMYRRNMHKIDDTIVCSKWVRFEYFGVYAGFFTHCKKHNANERTARLHYKKHGDFFAAMNHAISTRKQREAKNG